MTTRPPGRPGWTSPEVVWADSAESAIGSPSGVSTVARTGRRNIACEPPWAPSLRPYRVIRRMGSPSRSVRPCPSGWLQSPRATYDDPRKLPLGLLVSAEHGHEHAPALGDLLPFPCLRFRHSRRRLPETCWRLRRIGRYISRLILMLPIGVVLGIRHERRLPVVLMTCASIHPARRPRLTPPATPADRTSPGAALNEKVILSRALLSVFTCR